MGNVLSGCPCRRNRINSMKEITLLMIGLDNAGKTCTAKHLLGEPTCDGVPTVGFTSVQIRHGKYNVCIYDIGGGPKIRGIWKNYYALVHGLIFVVDASDTQRFEECKEEIGKVLKDERIAGKPMLLLFNKQDLDNIVNETELVNQLDLETLVNEQQCPTRVEASCAIYDQNKVKDPGIQEGFNWLIGHIGKEFHSLSERVEKEKDIQMKQEQVEKEKRMERVRKIREERERAEKEQERLNPNLEKSNAGEDDDDVIISDPFKPANVIREELEEKERAKRSKLSKENNSSPQSTKVKEEIILQPVFTQTLNNDDEDNRHLELMSLSNQDIHHESSHNSSTLHSFKPSKSEEDIRVGKTGTKKPKKRFKNRVAPQDETRLTNATELPPLKSHTDLIPNGFLSSQKHSSLNGALLHM